MTPNNNSGHVAHLLAAVLQQQLHDGGGLAAHPRTGQMDTGLLHRTSQKIRIGFSLQQVLDCVLAGVHGGEVEGRVLLLVGLVYLGAQGNEPSDEFNLVLDGGVPYE